MDATCTVAAVAAGDGTVIDNHICILVDIHDLAVVLICVTNTAINGMAVHVHGHTDIIREVDGVPVEAVAGVAELALYSRPISVKVNHNTDEALRLHFLAASRQVNGSFPAYSVVCILLDYLWFFFIRLQTTDANHSTCGGGNFFGGDFFGIGGDAQHRCHHAKGQYKC